MDSESDDVAPPQMFSFKRISGIVTPREDDEAVVRRFMKVMARDYEKELRLPSFLFQDRAEEEIPSDVILISSLGMWAVELDKCCCDQKRVTGDSWEDYAHRHHLKVDDVIWFEQVGKMVFRTHVLDQDSCCEKNLALPEEQAPKRRKVGQCWCEAEDHFKAEMREFHGKSNFLNLPTAFLKENPFVRMNERAIVVNSKGNAWEMGIFFPYAKQDNFTYAQLRGWHPFAKANNLEAGDVCIFRVDHETRLVTSNSFVLNVEIRK